MKEKKFLLFASRMNGEEFVLFEKSKTGYKTMGIKDLDAARLYFSEITKVLNNLPPKNINLYAACLKLMTNLKPVVIELPEENTSQLISENTANKIFIKFESDGFNTTETYCLKMKKSFVENHQVLDIMEDFQSTSRVRADGTITVNIFKEANRKNSIASEVEIKKILRERGLL